LAETSLVNSRQRTTQSSRPRNLSVPVSTIAHTGRLDSLTRPILVRSPCPANSPDGLYEHFCSRNDENERLQDSWMVTKERVFAARHDIGSLDREHLRIVKAGGVAGAIRHTRISNGRRPCSSRCHTNSAKRALVSESLRYRSSGRRMPRARQKLTASVRPATSSLSRILLM
jgi:hypothetical protein